MEKVLWNQCGRRLDENKIILDAVKENNASAPARDWAQIIPSSLQSSISIFMAT
jgi:hypothetical protein